MDLQALIVAARPRPIVDARNKLLLLWSAKSGCTFAVKWLFTQMGVPAACARPHKYRAELYKSEQQNTAVTDFAKAPGSYRTVKFIRDPFKRAVSAYIHADRIGYDDAAISTFLGRKVDATSRFSFREFLRYLESIDLTRCNIHHQLQTHALERRYMLASMFLVNLDHSMQTLPKLELFLGLDQSDPRRFRESAHHTRRLQDSADGFNGDKVFDIFNIAAPQMPDFRSFYDAVLTDRVVSLYAEDFVRYGFSPSLNDRGRYRA
ncbi:MAG: sulfotransferase family 2 domain-containing protein [Gammaproteobacteria bacterium]|nr:sulfotransferase family 2 domain-containing protein [Gammaproteobacteria bacterium]